MKKFVLSTLASFIVIFSQAQITKGSILLGGGVTFNKTKYDGSYPYNNSNYWGISPSFGIALKENLVYGININYYHYQYSSNNYGGGIFLRKYFPLGKNFYFFGEPELNYRRMKSESYPYATDYSIIKNWSLNLGLQPGISYAISRKFHLETGLGDIVYIYYEKTKTNHYYSNATVSTSKGSDFELNTNLGNAVQLNIGLRFLLAK
jgi:hypothetical protein